MYFNNSVRVIRLWQPCFWSRATSGNDQTADLVKDVAEISRMCLTQLWYGWTWTSDRQQGQTSKKTPIPLTNSDFHSLWVRSAKAWDDSHCAMKQEWSVDVNCPQTMFWINKYLCLSNIMEQKNNGALCSDAHMSSACQSQWSQTRLDSQQQLKCSVETWSHPRMRSTFVSFYWLRLFPK